MKISTGKPSRQFDHNNECIGCAAHLSDPCEPTCAFESGVFSPAVLLRAAAGRLREHPAGVGYDIGAAVFDAALELVGEREAATASEQAKQVLTAFLVDQWGPSAEAIRAEVVYRHGLFSDLPEIARSAYAAAARYDGIDFDPEAFGQFPTTRAASPLVVVSEQRLPHPNPDVCAECTTNRPTLLLTLSNGEQVTVCRPHAAGYRK